MQCGACGRINRAGARFCDGCGTPLTAQAVAPLAPPVPEHLAQKIRDARVLEGERKQVTVLFADVMGSMDLAEHEDPETWRAIMARLYGLLGDGVQRFEGTVDKFTGDGIMALFGAPIAHEDHAVRACYAALHLHRELAGYADELRRTRGLNLSVRIGLHSGEVVVGAIGDDLTLDYTAIGHTVGLAQRMESIAEPGSTYLTDETADLVTGLVELRDLGEFAIKGASAPVRVHELLGAGPARTRLEISRGRGFSRFVGRGDEMEVLETALERAGGGNGGVVGVVGEAGVGKSRLCEEFAQRAALRGLQLHRVAAASHARNVPFAAALDLLREFFGIEPADDDRTARERVAGRLLLLDPAFAEELPLLFDFLGIPDLAAPPARMDPQARSRRLLELGARIVRAQSVAEAGVLILEDLHWIDLASAVMLDGLVCAVEGTGSLVVANFRPEYRADWMERPHYSELPLVPLGPEAARELLDCLLGDDPSLDGLPEQLHERTGGNPFFVEEVVRGLAEEGVLAGSPGAYQLVGAVGEVAVPRTVHAVLAARIDRLEPADKALLQSAALVGREFGEPILRLLAALPGAELDASLARLVAADFLALQALFPEREYAFRHPLIQEVAYRSQLSERRARGHAAVAAALAELHADALDQRASLIAHHYDAAGDDRESARWHARAGAWAGTNDMQSAADHWRRVLELVGRLPDDDESRALGVAARLWVLLYGWRLGMPPEEAARVYAEGRELAERTGDRISQVMLMGTYAGLLGVAGEAAVSDEVSDEVEALLTDVPVDVELAAGSWLAYRLFVRGDLRALEEQLERGFAIAPGASVPGLNITSVLAWLHFLRALLCIATGRFSDAAGELDRGTAAAREHHDLETEGWLLLGRTYLAVQRADPGAALAAARRAAEIAERIGSDFSRVWATFYLALATAVTGEPERAIAGLERALALSAERRTGVEQRTVMLADLAWTRLVAGDVEGALRDARAALDEARADGVAIGFCHASRALVAALVAVDRLEEAERALADGLALARSIGARSFEAELLEVRVALVGAGGEPGATIAALEEAVALLEEIGAPARAAALAAAHGVAA